MQCAASSDRLKNGYATTYETKGHQPMPIFTAEKSKVISVDIENVEQRVDSMIELLTHAKSRLTDCLRTRSREDILDKRKKKLSEYALAQSLLLDGKNLEGTMSDGLLSQVVSLFGNALSEIVEETVRAETDIERQVISQLNSYTELQRQKNRDKEKLKELVLDRDSAQARLAGAQVRGERTDSIEDELDTVKSKVGSSKDVLSTQIFDLAAREVDMANIFRILIKTYMEYYKSVYSILEECLPRVTDKIDKYPRRPVYGCHLDDHLRYSGRSIAKVLEVCCGVLYESGIQLEGLFRVPGNVLKVKKLKSAFDAGEIDLSDAEVDTYAFAGALTSYLCSLPDSLMCNRLYDQWIEAAQISSPEEKRQAIKKVLDMLPHSNRENLRYFIKFLAKVAENQEFTKMGAKNLAIVASNSLLRSDNCDSVVASGLHGSLIECLISEADYFFPEEICFSSPSVCSSVTEDENFCGIGYSSLD
ncbi:unnamed protein product, partial [Soboliphyme baturini]|uniref:Rho-GAP domain-containing protein n=1 Tax=Soboliphyme baturini TaxID=241478 RepID=A0A183ISB1_9BILA